MDDKLSSFTESGFDAGKYVNEICTKCVGGSELNSEKAKMLQLNDQTNVSLKKTVYQHYGQFIETAKDISYLASEMCQISQMLRDQKTVIQNILDTSIVAPPRRTQNLNATVSPNEFVVKIKTNEDEERKKLLNVLEKVEGAGQIIEDEKRTLIFEGDLLEIDPDNYSAVQRKRGYLFSDGIMLAVWVTNRRGPQRYRFEAFYELGDVGMVVNIRDPECPKHTFKLLIFPSVYLLQCPNQQDKDAWVNHIEGRQKIIRNNPTHGKAGLLDSPTQETVPGFPSFDSERTKSPEGSTAMLSFQPPLPEWVVGIPEDLDVWIAQRNFIEAVDLYEAFQEFLESEPLSVTLKEIKVKVEMRIKQLIKVLVEDLEVMTPEKILQGGPRSIRKSIDLLIRLNRENQASKLFLTHRSAYIKQRMKRLKSDGRNQDYLANLSEVFFSSFLESIKEHHKAFSATTQGAAGLVVWVNSELTTFMTSFCRQLFTPHCHLSHVSSAVSAFRRASTKVSEIGLDVSTIVDFALLPYVERTVTDAKDKLVEAIRHRYRSQEESDLAMTFADEASLNRTLAEMKQLGVANMEGFVKDEVSLGVSSNTIAFSKSWLHFCQDVMELSAPEWNAQIQSAICEVLLFELPHLEHALNRARRKKDVKLVEMIEKDACLVLDVVATSANHIYEQETGAKCTQLTRILEDSSLAGRKGLATPSKVTRTRVTSTSAEFV